VPLLVGILELFVDASVYVCSFSSHQAEGSRYIEALILDTDGEKLKYYKNSDEVTITLPIDNKIVQYITDLSFTTFLFLKTTVPLCTGTNIVYVFFSAKNYSCSICRLVGPVFLVRVRASPNC